jgi:hypothetical protein
LRCGRKSDIAPETVSNEDCLSSIQNIDEIYDVPCHIERTWMNVVLRVSATIKPNDLSDLLNLS